MCFIWSCESFQVDLSLHLFHIVSFAVTWAYIFVYTHSWDKLKLVGVQMVACQSVDILVIWFPSIL